ncbi:MAG: hypothetical protein K6U14_07835 [Firmicutes bacterium]|nr:hypothetical protein [Alicyclobacillaceae bacterium]MCL6497526.1 hypothetical protein [Bacillota bacterium]
MLKVLVCLENAVEVDTVAPDVLRGEVDRSRVVPGLNPADAAALAWIAAWARRAPDDVRWYAATVGGSEAEHNLRRALGLGAAGVWRLGAPIDPLGTRFGGAVAVGQALAQLARELEVAVVLTGDRGSFWGSGQVPWVLAMALDVPYFDGVTAVDWAGPDAPEAVVQVRRPGGVRERWALSLPAVLGFARPDREALPDADLGAWLAANQAPIPVRPVGAGGSDPGRVHWGPPNPPVREVFTPAADAPVWTRVDQIVSGGVQRRQGIVRHGRPEALAEALVEFLEAHGYWAARS